MTAQRQVIDTLLEQTQLLHEINHKLTTLVEQAGTGPYGYRWTPEGLPICPKHGEVMQKREKQGDIWYSHRIIDTDTGEELYCRGYASKSGPGWGHNGSGDPPQIEPGDGRQPAAGSEFPGDGGLDEGAFDGPLPAETLRLNELARQAVERERQQKQAAAQPVEDARLAFYNIGSEAMAAEKISIEAFNALVNKAGRTSFAEALQELNACLA
jgi:hypothetical protein